MSSLALRRMPRTCTLASSPLPRVSLTYSLRRSSVSSGIVTRTRLPSFVGFTPRFGMSRIACSIAFSADLSYGVMRRVRASGLLIDASCASGVGLP